MKFKDLSLGSNFVFAHEKMWWSGGMVKGPWIKISSRKYCSSPQTQEDHIITVGSINAEVEQYIYQDHSAMLKD